MNRPPPRSPLFPSRAPFRSPDVEEQLLRQASDLALASAKVTPFSRITVGLSNGTKLPAEVKKFSPPLYVDNANRPLAEDRKSTRLNSSHDQTSYAVFCLKKK